MVVTVLQPADRQLFKYGGNTVGWYVWNSIVASMPAASVMTSPQGFRYKRRDVEHAVAHSGPRIAHKAVLVDLVQGIGWEVGDSPFWRFLARLLACDFAVASLAPATTFAPATPSSCLPCPPRSCARARGTR